MNSALISVIIPVYMVEKYLHKAVDSVVNQTYRNLEIILVDDGSSDNCPKMCDDYAAKDKRVRVVHKKNGGLSDARNVGIDVAKGDFIFFLDGDDHMKPETIEIMKTMQSKFDADVVNCNFYCEHEQDGSITVNHLNGVDKVTILEGNDILIDYFFYNTADRVMACCKLYRRELFFAGEVVRYPVGRLHEDNYTTYRLLDNAQRIVILNLPLVYYVKHEGSITSGMTEKRAMDIVGYYLGIWKYVNDGKHKYLEKMIKNYIVDQLFLKKLDWSRNTESNPYLSKLEPLENIVRGLSFTDIGNKQMFKILLDRCGLMMIVDRAWRMIQG